MNITLLIAATLTLLAALVHGIGGEMTTIQSLLSAGIDPVFTTELRVVWHMITIYFAASAVMLFLMARSANKALGRFLAIQYAAYGAAFFAVSAIHQTGLFQTPQWILMFLIAGLTYWGTR